MLHKAHLTLKIIKQLSRLFIITLVVIALPSKALTQSVDTNISAPDFSTVTLSGDTFTLANFRGNKPVYLFFWATWCPICQREIPRLKAFHQEFSEQIEILAINVGINDNINNVEQYQQKYNLPYALAFDDNSRISELFGVFGTPTQVIIDIDGHIRYQGHQFPHGLEKMLATLATAKR